MEKKNVVFLTVIAVATLLTAVVGATFAYYSVGVGGTGNSDTSKNTTVVETAVIAGVNYEGSSVAEAPADGAYPGWKGVQVFKISLPDNTPADAKGTYSIKLTPNVPAAFASDITYEVYKTTTPTTHNITRTAGTLTNNNGQISREDSLAYAGFTEGSGTVKSGTLTGTSVIPIEEVDYTGTLAETTYYVVYKYANQADDQSGQMGLTFSARVEVEVSIK